MLLLETLFFLKLFFDFDFYLQTQKLNILFLGGRHENCSIY